MSQKQNILDDLERHAQYPYGAHGAFVCGSVWLQGRMPRYAARIHDLKTDGYAIESGWCSAHKTATYRLVD